MPGEGDREGALVRCWELDAPVTGISRGVGEGTCEEDWCEDELRASIMCRTCSATQLLHDIAEKIHRHSLTTKSHRELYAGICAAFHDKEQEQVCCAPMCLYQLYRLYRLVSVVGLCV